MNSVNEILEYLKNHSSEKYKENVTKLGIPKENSLGVSIRELRKLAKKLKPSNALAKELWNTYYHEAKLLSVLLIDVYTVDPEWAISLMKDVVSWDLCDHLCKNLLYYLPEYNDLILAWQNDERLYYKRAAFSLIANAAVHDKKMEPLQLDAYLNSIQKHKSDARPHVRKAVSWALRELGKKDIESYKKAVVVAKKLEESDDKNKQWIGKDALREFKQLIPIKNRKRLVSKNSKMGKLYGNQS
ncbi:DNA alkylation repair protein [Tenacibaculum amylolyticum]|uniref:DNA alkylation repair protein n=1 Tax=Tenacibaculum amylolyticum TaxID=104269 RepID=UPI0038932D81